MNRRGINIEEISKRKNNEENINSLGIFDESRSNWDNIQ